MQLREYIFRKKTTVAALARSMGYTRGYLSAVMNGRFVAGKKLIKAVERATGGVVTGEEIVSAEIDEVSNVGG